MRNIGRRGRVVATSLGCAIVALAVVLRAAAAPSQEATLTASDGADGREVGSAVAMFGDTAIVGAPDQGAGSKQGSAYVFTRAAAAWSQRKKLTAGDGAVGDFFGVSAAISGNTVVVGAQGVATDTGAAYVFTGSGANWTQQAKLMADDATTFSRLGQSVAIDGDTIVAGAPANGGFRGAAYVFTRTGTKWTQQAKLTATNGDLSDQFGVSVAVSGDTILVGAFASDDGLVHNAGAAYVFTRTVNVWTQRAVLAADDGAQDDLFGVSVALSGTTAIVGAQTHDTAQISNSGAAYVFTGSGAVWTQEAQLVRAGGAAGDQFGIAVAVDGDTALVGAAFASTGSHGVAVVYKRTATTWAQQAEVTASDVAQGDEFGAAVALADGTAIVGSLGHANFGGAAYAFTGLPASALRVTTTKGSMTDSPKTSNDAVSVTCKVEFRPNSDGSFLQATESLRLSIGNPASPLVVEVAAGVAPTTAKLNGKKRTLTRTWKSAKGVHPKTTVKLVVPVGAPSTLTVTASSFDLPAGAAAGLVRVKVELGPDAGSDTDAWRTKGTKRLYP